MIPLLPLAPTLRVVACDAPVQSRKRGVAANHLAAADFAALAPGVSWWHTWFQRPEDVPPAGTKMEFVPMVWSDRQADLDNPSTDLAAGHRPRAVLAANEPNLMGRAFLSPERAAEPLVAGERSVPAGQALPLQKSASRTVNPPDAGWA